MFACADSVPTALPLVPYHHCPPPCPESTTQSTRLVGTRPSRSHVWQPPVAPGPRAHCTSLHGVRRATAATVLAPPAQSQTLTHFAPPGPGSGRAHAARRHRAITALYHRTHRTHVRPLSCGRRRRRRSLDITPQRHNAWRGFCAAGLGQAVTDCVECCANGAAATTPTSDRAQRHRCGCRHRRSGGGGLIGSLGGTAVWI